MIIWAAPHIPSFHLKALAFYSAEKFWYLCVWCIWVFGERNLSRKNSVRCAFGQAYLWGCNVSECRRRVLAASEQKEKKKIPGFLPAPSLSSLPFKICRHTSCQFKLDQGSCNFGCQPRKQYCTWMKKLVLGLEGVICKTHVNLK